MALQEDRAKPINYTVVAIDKDKNSQYAVKWAVDHLVSNNNLLILLHVRPRNRWGDSGMGAGELDPYQIFIPYRSYCARKTFHQIQMKEVLLDDTDIAKAIADFIVSNLISNVVLGGCSRNAFIKTFMKPDVPSCVIKAAPDFCSVYVIGRSKVLSVRSASRPIPNTATPPKISAPTTSQHRAPPVDNGPRTSLRMNDRSSVDSRNSVDRSSVDSRRGVRSRVVQPFNFWKTPSNVSMESIDGPSSYPGSDLSSIADDDSILDPFASRASLNVQDKNFDFSFVSDSTRDERPSISSVSSATDVEAEMKRLRLELKQTMDMYGTACREAITAKHQAQELNDWKSNELRRFEQTRYSKESAFANIELEKAKCRVATEAAQAAQRLAEKEAQKRKVAEMKAKQEAGEKNRALSRLAHSDVRYRKYTIQEIEIATDKFDPNLKVGEGGYGPVFRGILDHTPVAIKILRPDAAQGRKQFQQEVEVLSRMRHPHMVLLLGACPEYGCLVYEYLNNGSLEDRLYRKGNTPSIPWRIRFKIAAEIATSLSFLHQAKPEPLVHRDLKPANILLDKNYVSKIADVGLARLVPPSVADTVTQYHMTSAAGTFCYIDPEYQQSGMLTTKSDVYSFGVLLLQIITGKPPMGLTHQVQRAIDHGIFGEVLDQTVYDWPLEETLCFAKLALQCCELRKKDRPDLGKVLLPELMRLSEFGMSDDDYRIHSYHQPKDSITSLPRSSLSSGSQLGSSDTSVMSVETAPWPSQASDDSTSFPRL